MAVKSVEVCVGRIAAAITVWAATAAGSVLHGDDPGSQTRPTQSQSIRALMDLGNVAIRVDEKQPSRPVVAVDFEGNPEFKEPWLRYLAGFPNLRELSLSNTALSDTGLRQLRGLQELEILSLSTTKVTDAGLAELKGLTKLRRLDVRDTAVTRKGVATLRQVLPNLEAVLDGATVQRVDGLSTFSIEVIKKLRKAAAAASEVPEGTPEGWSKSRANPTRLVTIFAPLKVRKGLVLRAYQFKEEANGNGIVWAMPADSEFPEPKDCPKLDSHLFKAPKPSEALDDVMDAIEGDGSPWSYLAASLLRRQFTEFGAMWHGYNWTFYHILDADPWKDGPPREEGPLSERPSSPRDNWTWVADMPQDFRPRVQAEGDQVTVTFYTYCGLEKQRIYQHTDTYRAGKYRARIEQKTIAENGPGFLP